MGHYSAACTASQFTSYCLRCVQLAGGAAGSRTRQQYSWLRLPE